MNRVKITNRHKADDILMEKEEEVQAVAFNFFSELGHTSPQLPNRASILRRIIQPFPSEQTNSLLNEVIIEEIKNDCFSIIENKASGLMDLMVIFFSKNLAHYRRR